MKTLEFLLGSELPERILNYERPDGLEQGKDSERRPWGSLSRQCRTALRAVFLGTECRSTFKRLQLRKTRLVVAG